MGLVRFILALSVLIVHSSPIAGIQFVPGYLAVQSFYIISGFYMALIYTQKYSKTSRPVYNFYTNRFLRLYPLYLFVVLLIIGLSIIYGLWLGSYGKLEYYAQWYERQPESIESLCIIFFFNLSLIGQDIITFFNIDASGYLYFIGFSDLKIQELLFIPIAWTVSVEMTFYLATPFISKRKISTIVSLILLVLLIRAALFFLFDVRSYFSVYRFAPTEFFWFLLGVLSFKLCKNKWFPQKKYATLFLIIWILLLLLYRYYQIDWIVFSFTFLFTPAIFYKFSTSDTDRYLGDLAYPIYISHMLFILIISANRFPKNYGSGLPLLIMTMVFSILSYHFILKPIDKLRMYRIKANSQEGD